MLKKDSLSQLCLFIVLLYIYQDVWGTCNLAYWEIILFFNTFLIKINIGVAVNYLYCGIVILMNICMKLN